MTNEKDGKIRNDKLERQEKLEMTNDKLEMVFK